MQFPLSKTRKRKANGITFSTGVKYSATPSAVPFTEFITLCIVDGLYATISEWDGQMDRQPVKSVSNVRTCEGQRCRSAESHLDFTTEELSFFWLAELIQTTKIQTKHANQKSCPTDDHCSRGTWKIGRWTHTDIGHARPPTS